jgi:CubicO group peptidase (beta-lactamase class C family)
MTRRFPTVAVALCLLVGCAAAPHAVNRDAGLADLPAKLQKHVDQQEVAGVVVAVVRDGELKHLSAVGMADREAGKPMRIDSMFWIASMTKSITATAVMILVDEGKLSLDEPVEKYIPAIKKATLRNSQPPAKPITIRQLMCHTTGLAQPPRKPTDHNLTLAKYADQIAAGPLEFEPGSKYEYAFGLTLAGRIVEIVSGQSFDQFLHDRIFVPCDMPDTTFFPTAQQMHRIAKTYKNATGRDGKPTGALVAAHNPFVTNDPTVINEPEPSGGLFSTATDMTHFYQMILGGGVYRGKRIVSPASVREMTRPQMKIDDKKSYGLGWFVYPDGSFGHGGAYATDGLVDPKHKLITVFMVQSVAGSPGATKKAFTDAVNAAAH